MSERPAAVLPDRVTVLTCLGCGAMGRQEGCAGNCIEHRLPLVAAADFDALLAAATSARERAARLEPVVRAFAADDEADGEGAVLAALRERARGALHPGGREASESSAAPPPGPQISEALAPPESVVGWWCSRCGNVDLPQPCIGVCVWEPVVWVNRDVYEWELAALAPVLRAGWELHRFLARAAAATPRPGQEARNRAALREQARAVLDQVGERSTRSTISDASATSASRTNPSP